MTGFFAPRRKSGARRRWLTRAAALAASTGLIFGLAAAAPTASGAAASSSLYPRIWGDRVVYQDNPTGDLRSWDLSTQRTVTIPWANGSSAALGQTPSLQDSNLAFFDRDFHVRSLVLGHAPTPVYSAGQAIEMVRQWGQYFAWVDGSSGPQIWAKVGAGAPWRVAATSASQGSPSLYGSKLVWEDFRKAGDADIFFKDLASSSAAADLSSVAGDQRYPAIWGDRVVWQDARSGKIDAPDIYTYTLGAAGTGSVLIPDPYTALSAPMAMGAATAKVGSTAGFEAGDWATVGGTSDLEYLRVKQVDAPSSSLVFERGASLDHASGAVQVQGRQERPAIWADGSGNYSVVWQDSRKTRPDLPSYDIRMRSPDGTVRQLTNTQVLGGDARDNASYTRPQIYDDRIVWQDDAGGLGLYELRPHVYGQGAATAVTDKVRVHASFAGHRATFRFGFGSTPGATDLSVGYGESTTSAEIVLVPRTSSPGSDEMTVPASSISLPAGSTCYVTAQVTEAGVGQVAVTSPPVIVDTVAPGAPSGLSQALRGGEPYLTWTAAADSGSGVDHYRIRRSAGGGTASVIADTKDTFFTDDGTFGDAAAPVIGTTYEYAVTAVDAAGNESGPASVQATPKATSQITLTPSAAKVMYSGTLTLSAHLSADAAAVAENPSVTLLTRSASTNWAWRPARVLTMSSAGLASWSLKPVVNAYWRVSWTGSSLYAGSDSGSPYVQVLAKVTARPSASRVRRGARLAVAGSVLPKHRGKYVYLQRYSSKRWVRLASARLSVSSAYRLLWRAGVRGKLLLRVYFPDGDGRHSSAERRFYVVVR